MGKRGHRISKRELPPEWEKEEQRKLKRTCSFCHCVVSSEASFFRIIYVSPKSISNESPRASTWIRTDGVEWRQIVLIGQHPGRDETHWRCVLKYSNISCLFHLEHAVCGQQSTGVSSSGFHLIKNDEIGPIKNCLSTHKYVHVCFWVKSSNRKAWRFHADNAAKLIID